MKKIFSLFAAILFAGSMMAADVEITLANSGWTTTRGEQTCTISGVTVTCSDAVGNTQLRLYKNSTTTISVASTSVITKIVFTCTANGTSEYGPGNFTAQTGYSYSSKTGTWVGEATSVSFVAGGSQVRATSIVVTVEDAPAVITPVITGAAQFFDEQDITITCATEGVSIYYTLDGSEPTASSIAYSDKFAINATKTVKAIAIKGSDKSAIASATFEKAGSYASFEALVAADLEANTYAEVIFSDVVIDSIYVNSKNVRRGLFLPVMDKTGAKPIELYYSVGEVAVPDTWVAGGKISGTVRGNWTVYNNQWELVPLAADWTWANINYTAPEGTPEVPVFSVAGGIFSAAQSVELSCATDGAAIHYTLDGTDPTDASAIYSAPIVVSATTTIKAIAIKGSKSSIVVSETYIFPEGAGTKDDPYTCADVTLINNMLSSGKYWVEGYIVGSAADGGVIAASSTAANIALGDAANQTANLVPVALPTGAVREALNIVDNPSNVGKKVKVYGNLVAYFSVPGVKNTSDYELSGATAIDNTAAEVKAVKFFENGQLRIMKNGVVYNALGEIVR